MRKQFKVGINEGVIIARKELDNIELYTDSLAGCVALVVASDEYVFMVHVLSDTVSEQSAINDRAKKYLDDVIDWMKKEKGGNGRIQIGLVADSMYTSQRSNTCKALEEACDTEDKNIVIIKKSGNSCVVNFNYSGGLTLDVGTILVPSKKLERPSFVKHNINASRYGFGKACSGDDDYDVDKQYAVEDIPYIFDTLKEQKQSLGENKQVIKGIKKKNEAWIGSNELRNAVTVMYNYSDNSMQFVNTILSAIRYYVEENNFLLVSDKERCDICKGILLSMQGDNFDLDGAVKEIIPKVLNQNKILNEQLQSKKGVEKQEKFNEGEPFKSSVPEKKRLRPSITRKKIIIGGMLRKLPAIEVSYKKKKIEKKEEKNENLKAEKLNNENAFIITSPSSDSSKKNSNENFIEKKTEEVKLLREKITQKLLNMIGKIDDKNKWVINPGNFGKIKELVSKINGEELKKLMELLNKNPDKKFGNINDLVEWLNKELNLKLEANAEKKDDKSPPPPPCIFWSKSIGDSGSNRSTIPAQTDR